MKPLKPGSQRYRVVSAFFEGRRMTRFDAEQIGAHALNSVISDLEALGLHFDRRNVCLATKWGDAHVCEYWLNQASFDLAAALLGIQRNRAPVAPDSAALLYAKASRG